MRTEKMGRVLVAIAASMLFVASQAAQAEELGQVFRLNGWYRGVADISDDGIKCEIPTVGSAIPDATFSMGLWNTYGAETVEFPGDTNPLGNPCGGWLQLQNNMTSQGIFVERIDVKMRIAWAARLRDQVPTRNGWPVECRVLRRMKVFAGTRLDPIASVNEPSQSGQSNVAFVKIIPIIAPQVIACLRAQYASLPTEAFTSLPVIITTRAFGVADNGDRFSTNPTKYTLTLRHSCGNGRVDDGEFCDPESSLNTCMLGGCSDEGLCGDTNVPCATDADCIGTCVPQGNPMECVCGY